MPGGARRQQTVEVDRLPGQARPDHGIACLRGCWMRYLTGDGSDRVRRSNH
jgi:hypothetical protein